MAELTAERKATAKLAMRYLMKPETRKHLKEHGFEPQAPVVACEWESSVSEVLGMLRMQDGSKHVIVLIRKDEEILTLFATTEEAPDDSVSVSASEMHGQSTIGLVYETLQVAKYAVHDPKLPPRTKPRIGQYGLIPA